MKVMTASALVSSIGMMTSGMGITNGVDNQPGEELLFADSNQPIVQVKDLPFRIHAAYSPISKVIKKNENTTASKNISWEKSKTAAGNPKIGQHIMSRFPTPELLQGSKSNRTDKKQTVSIATVVEAYDQDQKPSFTYPVNDHSYTSLFGMRNGYHHNGIDIVSQSRNLDVLAAKTGTVVSSQFHTGGLGNLVIIDHGNGYESYYGHLSKRLVKEGDLVRAGDLIGVMGNTGNSTGTHLHFEIRKNNVPLNPLSYLQN